MENLIKSLGSSLVSPLKPAAAPAKAQFEQALDKARGPEPPPGGPPSGSSAKASREVAESQPNVDRKEPDPISPSKESASSDPLQPALVASALNQSVLNNLAAAPQGVAPKIGRSATAIPAAAAIPSENESELNALGQALGAVSVTGSIEASAKSDAALAKAETGPTPSAIVLAPKSGSGQNSNPNGEGNQDKPTEGGYVAKLGGAESNSSGPRIANETNAVIPLSPVGSTTNDLGATADVKSADKVEVAPRLDAAKREMVVKQVSDRIELLAATRPKEGMTIHLQPAELGQVVINLKAGASHLEALIQASDSRVKDALEQNSADLSQKLHHHGIQLGQITVEKSAASTFDFNPNRPQMDMQMSPDQGSSHRHDGLHKGSSATNSVANGALTTGEKARTFVSFGASGVDYVA